MCTFWLGLRGLTPCRAARCAVENLPKPVNESESPRFKVSVTESRKSSTAFAESRFERPLLDATWSTNSCFVTCPLLPVVGFLPTARNPTASPGITQPCGFAGTLSPRRRPSGARRPERAARGGRPRAPEPRLRPPHARRRRRLYRTPARPRGEP